MSAVGFGKLTRTPGAQVAESVRCCATAKIAKLSARMEALVTASDGRVVYIWRDRRQTEMEVCEAHYKRRPDDPRASHTCVIGWLEGE